MLLQHWCSLKLLEKILEKGKPLLRSLFIFQALQSCEILEINFQHNVACCHVRQTRMLRSLLESLQHLVVKL